MTADPSIDPATVLAEQLERAEPDLLRALLKTYVEALMAADADAVGEPAPRREQRRRNRTTQAMDQRRGVSGWFAGDLRKDGSDGSARQGSAETSLGADLNNS